MKLRRVGAFAAIASLLSGVALQLPAQAGSGRTLRVVVSSPHTIGASYRARLAATSSGTLRADISSNEFAVELPVENVRRFEHTIAEDYPGTTVLADHVITPTAIPNDPCVASCSAEALTGERKAQTQWNLRDIHAPAAWKRTKGSASVLVAVVDSGVNASAPELKGKVAKSIDEIPGTPADLEHGTNVAAIIAANTNNGIKIAGVSWKSRIISVRVLGLELTGEVSGYASDAAAGIFDAVDAGADIINLSWGSLSDDVIVQGAIGYAVLKHVVVVAAGSNAHTTAPVFPAAYPDVIAVSGVDQSNDNTRFETGPTIDVYAPAVPILTIAASGYLRMVEGTSFAAPQVAGAAALIMARYPNVQAEAVAAMIKSTARKVKGRTTGVMHPLLDINAALSAKGYWLAATDGYVRNEGTAPRYRSVGRLAKPVVGMAPTAPGSGYWTVAADGGVFAFGDATFFGSMGGRRLNAPIVGMAATPSGKGYWLVASDGGIFAFGDATFFGSMGGRRLNAPIVGMAATPSGKGYWLVASDGGIFAFGRARFYGSLGAMRLNRPVVATAHSASGRGYWLVTSDGGVFAFGDAKFHGSAAGIARPAPVVSIARTRRGNGYFILTRAGEVYPFGDARDWGQGRSSGRAYVGIAPSS